MTARAVGLFIVNLCFVAAMAMPGDLRASETDESEWLKLDRGAFLLGGAIIPELGDGFWMRLRTRTDLLRGSIEIDTNDTAVLLAGTWLYLGEHQVRLRAFNAELPFVRLSPAVDVPSQIDDASVRGGIALELLPGNTLGLSMIQAFTANDTVVSFSGIAEYVTPKIFDFAGSEVGVRYRLDVPYAGDDLKSRGFVELSLCSPGVHLVGERVVARICALGRWDKNAVEELVNDVEGFFSLDPTIANFVEETHVSTVSALLGVSIGW